MVKMLQVGTALSALALASSANAASAQQQSQGLILCEINGYITDQSPCPPEGKVVYSESGKWSTPTCAMADMPCGDTTTEEDLRLAAAYCDNELLNHAMAGSYFIDDACYTVHTRWQESAWKRAQDAEQAKETAAEIAHAKAFVEAVAKQKKGKGE